MAEEDGFACWSAVDNTYKEHNSINPKFWVNGEGSRIHFHKKGSVRGVGQHTSHTQMGMVETAFVIMSVSTG